MHTHTHTSTRARGSKHTRHNTATLIQWCATIITIKRFVRMLEAISFSMWKIHSLAVTVISSLRLAGAFSIAPHITLECRATCCFISIQSFIYATSRIYDDRYRTTDMKNQHSAPQLCRCKTFYSSHKHLRFTIRTTQHAFEHVIFL